MKFAQKRSAPKWTCNKMGNAKKGHNKTGRTKVVVPKRRTLDFRNYKSINKLQLCYAQLM